MTDKKFTESFENSNQNQNVVQSEQIIKNPEDQDLNKISNNHNIEQQNSSVISENGYANISLNALSDTKNNPLEISPEIKNADSEIKIESKKTENIIYLKYYEKPNFYINTIDLNIDINDEETIVTSVLDIIRNTEPKSMNSPLELDGEEIDLKYIAIDNKELTATEYKITKSKLIINSVPNSFKLKIITGIKPQNNTALSGLYKSGSMYCTQCEAEGFRRITYYLDRPDVMAKFTTTIKADKFKYPILLSNGNLTNLGNIDSQRHFATWEDPFKKPSYLFAMVAGNLVGVTDTYVTYSGKIITLKLYVEHQNLDKTKHALMALKKAMTWDEKFYGREYDLNNYIIVATDNFNMGAMENKGLNIFNSKYILARPETATDQDFEAIDAVVGHEYFHNWSGNRVTLRDWFQLSLKEGFTVFREQQFTKYITNSPTTRIEEVRLLRSRQFVEDAGPMAHPVQPKSYMEINNFYTVTIYEKGAEIIRMIYTILGNEKFRKGTDLYFDENDGKAVTIEEFVQAMERANDIDLSQFRLWYSQAGTPIISISEYYNSEDKTYTLNLKQHCPKTPDQTTEKKAMHIPISLGLLDKNGNDLPLNLIDEDVSPEQSNHETSNKKNQITRVLSLTQQEQSFTFQNIPHKPILSILRDFSAPVKIQYKKDNKELAFQLMHDSNSFNRWDAGINLMQNFIFNCVKRYKNKSQFFLDGTLALAFTKAISDPDIHPSLKACIMQGPSISELINNMEIADIDGIFEARKFMLFELAKENKKILLDLYYNNKTEGVYEYNPKDMAKRNLKNTSLSYLMRLNEENITNICYLQLEKANNMTDAISALSFLSNNYGKDREKALGDFYKKWQHEPLVINKWFSVQARSELPNTLSNVKRLMKHQAFDIKNPNNVYSLVGGFASGNPVRFHDKSGNGYKFLTNVVLELNSLNPQVAARMIQPFTEWHKFDLNRQKLIKEELEQIYNTPKLSKDLLEIVKKTLEFNLT